MSRDIYEMLNSVETDLTEYRTEDMDDLELQRLKKNLRKTLKTSAGKNGKSKGKKKKIAAGVSVAAAVLVVSLAAGPYQRIVQAAVKAVSYDIASLLGIKEDLSPYKTVVGQSVTKNGVTVTLNEVILDDGVVYVSSTQKYDKPMTMEEASPISPSIFVNGREVSYGAGGGMSQEDEYTFVSIFNCNIKDIPMDEIHDFEIQFWDIHNNQDNWSFAFSASGEELAENTNRVEMDEHFTLEDGTVVNLTKITDNPMGQRIHFTTSTETCDYDLKLTGKDDLGNPVEFDMSTFSGGKGVLEISTIHNGNLSEEAKELYLTPYAVAFPKESGRLSNDFKQVGEEFCIKLR